MIQVNQFGEITQFKMGREVGTQAADGFSGEVFYWTSAYLVDGLLIDTGCPHTAEEFAGFLKGKNIDLVVNTHFHEDHIGANYLLQKNRDLRILASRESIPLIDRVPKIYPYQELVWGYPVPTRVEPLPERIETKNFRFEVIETPGHCAGHVALVELGRGWCFSGDLYVSREPKSIRADEDVALMARSMQRLLDLETRELTLFTSLGNIIPDGREALSSCITYLKELSRKSKELEKAGMSPGAIRDKLFGRETALYALTDGDMSSENMVRSALRARF